MGNSACGSPLLVEMLTRVLQIAKKLRSVSAVLPTVGVTSEERTGSALERQEAK